MKIFAISGSTRRDSTNTALLRALKALAPTTLSIEVYACLGELPVFSPDLEGLNLPAPVQRYFEHIRSCDGLLISSPEYIRAIPGGLKNALDWLVSDEHIVGKPIALAHASHRGDDMLASLRLVLSTISSQFNTDLFLRLPLLKETPEAIWQLMHGTGMRAEALRFLQDFSEYCDSCASSPKQ